jgi:hypothetical protein
VSCAGLQRRQQPARRIEAGRRIRKLERDAQLVRAVHPVMLRLALDQADHRHRVDVRFRLELQSPAFRAERQLADAERGRLQFQFGDGEQVLGRVRQQAEAVDHLDLQFA